MSDRGEFSLSTGQYIILAVPSFILAAAVLRGVEMSRDISIKLTETNARLEMIQHALKAYSK